ncbi:unnamed protein product [Didymodactylos carnosus]|uniref:LTD domain-containing protein n=1 Tax=Didymodactylos carnosus TaxID=1234261 RepID=A0A814LRK5_9BILA|nr:unnamed protein product [Didymodactylos carnosus]CAF1068693.1 unnamed protein product [Didymodactylos carnosus]CAF3599445.1 unnamed protein product [Didymodactylos carnosus]CAF3836077.1 unnamed protein product [Didymodactylos carnosus]
MALMQRFTSTVSAQNTAGIIHDVMSDDGGSKIIKDITVIQNRDEMEKQHLHSLNDRLEDLIGYLDSLELANKQLSDDIHSLIDSWGITGENRFRLLQDLDQTLSKLKDINRKKIIFNVESKIFDEQAEFLNRLSSMYIDVLNLYKDKCNIIKDLQFELEDELKKIQHRLQLSDQQVKKLDEDYRNEIEKFRQYMIEWSQLALDKQHLLNDIQSLKEQYNLKLAYNQEEIQEWQRLLQRFSHDSKNYYKDYLETIKQQIYNDYEQMAKEQQQELEQTLKTRLSEVQKKISMGVPISDQNEQQRLDQIHRLESRMEERQREHDHWNNEYRRLLEDTQRKRRLLLDLESEQDSQQRKDYDKQEYLKQSTDILRQEYYQLKDELDRLGYNLRFSVEEELKIYEALLNSLHRKKGERINIIQRQVTTPDKMTRIPRENEDRNRYSALETLVTTATTRTPRESEDRNRHSALETLVTTATTRTPRESEDRNRHSTLETLVTTTTTRTPRESEDRNWHSTLGTLVTTATTSSSIAKKQEHDHTVPIIMIEQPNGAVHRWQHDGLSRHSSPSSESERLPSSSSSYVEQHKSEMDTAKYGYEQNLTDINKTTMRTTRKLTYPSPQPVPQKLPEIDEELLQKKIHITRKYKGNILIKFVDVSGRFVEIENTDDYPRDLTDWYIIRDVDGRRYEYYFPIYELEQHTSVRIYGNYHRRSADDEFQLIAKFHDWGNGRRMETRLYNPDNKEKALFEQTIRE